MAENATLYEMYVPVYRQNSYNAYKALRVSIEFIGDMHYEEKRGYWLWVLPCTLMGGRYVPDRGRGNRVLMIPATQRSVANDKLARVQARVRTVEQAKELCSRYSLIPLGSVIPETG